MKAAGVALVILSGLLLIDAAAGNLTHHNATGTQMVITAVLLVGGLIVWSLQQIREALIGGHPRNIKAGVDEHGYKAVRPVGRKAKWERTPTE